MHATGDKTGKILARKRKGATCTKPACRAVLAIGYLHSMVMTRAAAILSVAQTMPRSDRTAMRTQINPQRTARARWAVALLVVMQFVPARDAKGRPRPSNRSVK